MSDAISPPASRLDHAALDFEHPWPGLLSFSPATRAYFFGRDAEIAEIVSRIRENPLTILFGQSGLGKTSLLGAGVTPRLLNDGYTPITLRLDFDLRAPSLLEQTRAALFRAVPELARPAEASPSTLWEIVHSTTGGMSKAMPPVALIFDQFEEIFTLGGQDPLRAGEVDAWLMEVSDLLQNRPPRSLEERFAENRRLARDYDFDRVPVHMVFSLREDHIHHLEAWKTRLPLVVHNRMALHPLTGIQAMEAVLGPASLGPEPLVSREVAAVIVRTVAKVVPESPLAQIRAVPPLLSLLCEQLNAARLKAGARSMDLALVEGRSADILSRFYEESFDSFAPEFRPAIREILEARLVTVGGHRHPLAREDAESELAARGVPFADGILDRLIQRRLLTSEEHNGVQRLEITHDVLVPLLVRSRKERKGRDLELAIRKRAKFTLFVLTFILLILAATVLSTLLMKSRVEQGRGLIREQKLLFEVKMKSAISELNVYNYFSSAYHAGSSVGYQTFGRVETDGAVNAPVSMVSATHATGEIKYDKDNLREATELIDDNIRGFFPVWSSPLSAHGRGYISDLTMSGDGVLLASTDEEEIRIWDSHTGQLVRSLPNGNKQVGALAFSPDRRFLVSGSSGSSPVVWDVRTGELYRKLSGCSLDRVHSLAAHPTLPRFLLGHNNGTLEYFDLERNQVLWTNQVRRGVAYSPSFSPDGSLLVCGGEKDVQVWRVQGGKIEEEAVLTTQGYGFAAAFDPEGTRLFASSGPGQIRAWKCSTWKEEDSFQGAIEQEYSSISIAMPENVLLATSLIDGWVEVFDLKSKKLLQTIKISNHCSNLTPPQRSLGRIFLSSENRIVSTDAAQLRAGQYVKSEAVGEVKSVTFSPDGSLLAGVFGGRDIMVHDALTGARKARIQSGHGYFIYIFFNDDGSLLTAVNEFGGIMVHDCATFVEPKTHEEVFNESIIKGNEHGSHPAIDRTKGHIALPSLGYVELFDSSGKRIKMFETNKPASQLVSPLAELKLFPATRQYVPLTDLATVAFDPQGKYLLLSWTGVLQCIDLSGGNAGWLTNNYFTSKADVLRVSPDSRRLAAVFKDKIVVYKTVSGEEVNQISYPGTLFDLAFNADRSVLAAVGPSWLRAWRLSDSKLLCHQELPGVDICSLAFDPTGTRLLCGTRQQTLVLFDFFPWPTETSSSGSTHNNLAFSPDGTFLAWTPDSATEPEPCKISVFDGETLMHLRDFDGDYTGHSQASFSPDGRVLAVGATYSRAVLKYDLDSGSKTANFGSHDNAVTSAVLWPDGRSLSSGSYDDQLRVWNLEEGSLLRSVALADSFGGPHVVLPSTGQVITPWSRSSIAILDPQTLDPVRLLIRTDGRDYISRLAATQDSTRLAASFSGGPIHVWDLSSSSTAVPMVLEDEQGGNLCFSSDGTRLISGGTDGIIRMWDSVTGQPVGKFRASSGGIKGLAFHPKGHMLVSTSGGAEKSNILGWDSRFGNPDLAAPLRSGLVVAKDEHFSISTLATSLWTSTTFPITPLFPGLLSDLARLGHSPEKRLRLWFDLLSRANAWLPALRWWDEIAASPLAKHLNDPALRIPFLQFLLYGAAWNAGEDNNLSARLLDHFYQHVSEQDLRSPRLHLFLQENIYDFVFYFDDLPEAMSSILGQCMEIQGSDWHRNAAVALISKIGRLPEASQEAIRDRLGAVLARWSDRFSDSYPLLRYKLYFSSPEESWWPGQVEWLLAHPDADVEAWRWASRAAVEAVCRHELAFSLLERLIGQFGSQHSEAVHAAWSYMQLKDFSSARNLFEDVLRQGPSWPASNKALSQDLYLGLALCRKITNDSVGASEAYRLLIHMDAKWAKTLQTDLFEYSVLMDEVRQSSVSGTTGE